MNGLPTGQRMPMAPQPWIPACAEPAPGSDQGNACPPGQSQGQALAPRATRGRGVTKGQGHA